jgi:hypothetical protein
MRVCGECCGLRRRGFEAVKGRVLSLGADSLCESALWICVNVLGRVLNWHWWAERTAARLCRIITHQAAGDLLLAWL